MNFELLQLQVVHVNVNIIEFYFKHYYIIEYQFVFSDSVLIVESTAIMIALNQPTTYGAVALRDGYDIILFICILSIILEIKDEIMACMRGMVVGRGRLLFVSRRTLKLNNRIKKYITKGKQRTIQYIIHYSQCEQYY